MTINLGQIIPSITGTKRYINQNACNSQELSQATPYFEIRPMEKRWEQVCLPNINDPLNYDNRSNVTGKSIDSAQDSIIGHEVDHFAVALSSGAKVRDCRIAVSDLNPSQKVISGGISVEMPTNAQLGASPSKLLANSLIQLAVNEAPSFGYRPSGTDDEKATTAASNVFYALHRMGKHSADCIEYDNNTPEIQSIKRSGAVTAAQMITSHTPAELANLKYQLIVNDNHLDEKGIAQIAINSSYTKALPPKLSQDFARQYGLDRQQVTEVNQELANQYREARQHYITIAKSN